MSKAKTIALFVLQILLAGMFVMAALAKLGGAVAMVAMFRNYGYPDKFYLLVGAVELLGAIALLIPRLTAYGAAALAVIMVGASVTHLLSGEAPRVSFTGFLLILLVVVGYLRRPPFLRRPS